MIAGDEAAGDEAAWISRVMVHDDHDAFAALVRLHQQPVLGFLRKLCGEDWQRADDLAQETFWKAYRHIAGYRGQGRFLGWLFGIAWQLHVGQQRGSAARRFEPLNEDVHELPDQASDPLDRYDLEQLLGQLRPEEQAAMILHYMHGMSHSEIAGALGLPLGTVKSMIARSRAKLRKLASAEDDEPKTERAP